MKEETFLFKEKINSREGIDRECIFKAMEWAADNSIGPASILLELGLDTDTIIAALVLDYFRINPSPKTTPGQFSPAVMSLVEGVKKIDSLKTNNQTIYEAQNIRNMLFALSDDIRVILIKLSEKLHALYILDSHTDKDRKTTARECLNIYAPLADRLGISWIKNEMEDLSLKFLNRETYQQIKSIVSEKKDLRNKFLELVKETIIAEAGITGIKAEVESRAKHFYSIYMKMRKRGKSIGEIHDLFGIRIICGSIENCYTLMGVVHRLWKPINGCFKDYIARPKPNGYQSLHTSVMVDTADTDLPELDAEVRQMEVQIRTEEMHRIAENGIASHWLYKKGSSRDLVQEKDINLVNKLMNWKQEGQDTHGISGSQLDSIKNEIFRNTIYVFTPQGKVIKLPAGSTPIDFAYSIHTAIGEHCIGAKANGSIIPLSSQLKNTQTVEILTSPSAHPHQNWLQVAKTAKTRNKIRSWLEKNNEYRIAEKTPELKKKTSAETAAVLDISAAQTLPQKVMQPLSSVMRVRIEDEKNFMVRFARCCNPVTGDSITGYVSRGRGIIIHRNNCKNLANNTEYEKRKIDAEWDIAGSELFKRIRVEAHYSPNLFSEIEGAIRKRQGHLLEGRLEESADNRLSGTFTMRLVQASDLKALLKNIRGIPGIIGIQAMN